MKTDTKKRILDFAKINQEVTAHEITNFLGFSSQIVHRHLKDLVAEKLLKKIGTPPRVFYQFVAFEKATPEKKQHTSTSNSEDMKIVEDNFLTITPSGEIHRGWDGFLYWTERTNQNAEKVMPEYVRTLEKYNSFRDEHGLINGTEKFKSTFHQCYLNEVYYVDFYSIERFGKTKLGALLLYAKQSQDKKLMKEIAEIIRPKVEFLVHDKQIDAIGYIPHTVPRKVQLMPEIERLLGLQLPRVPLVKAVGDIPVAQKTLNKLDDRIENANATIFVRGNYRYSNILLLDDAIGSGATLNQTAKKIREKNLAKHKLYGLALTGSFKGFEVLNEV